MNVMFWNLRMNIFRKYKCLDQDAANRSASLSIDLGIQLYRLRFATIQFLELTILS